MEVLFLRQEQPGAAEDIQDAERHRHALRDDRRHTGTGHAHAQRCDEPEVEDDVEHRREDEEDQRHEAVADGSQQTGTEVVSEHDEDAVVDDDDIAVGVLKDLDRGVQQLQQRVQAQRAGQRDDRRRDESDDDGACNGLLELLVVSGPVGARCDDGKTVAAVDCLVPGIGEIIGGSQREDDYDKLKARMDELGLKEEDYKFYMDLRKYGSTRHAGFGLGFERCVMYLTGMGNIRDVIPFPRTVNNCDL